MATQRKHQPQARKGGRLFRIYIVLSMLLIVAAMAAGSLVFFKAHRFEVTGNNRYTAEELLEAANIAEGSNLVRIPRRDIARRMEQTLPYLKRVRIHTLPPDRVVIDVVETEPAGAVSVGSAVWYLDSGGKLLEQVSANKGYPVISGLHLVDPEVGTVIQVGEDESLKAKGLRSLLLALEQHGMLTKVQSVDLTSASYLSIRYDNRLTVKMGLADDFNYDLKMLSAALEGYIAEHWSQGDTGTLDMTKREGEAILSLDS